MDHQSFFVSQLYDSHVHWLSTGDVAMGLQLHNLKNQKSLRGIQDLSAYRRGEWLSGFGWDENNFESDLHLHREVLDAVFSDTPVLWSRIDGHSSWLNSSAMKKMGWMNEQGKLIKEELADFLPMDAQGRLQGIALETAHMQAIMNLPRLTRSQTLERLLKAQNIFLEAGITHIRDMTANLDIWDCASELESKNQLQFHVEFNFSCEDKKDFSRALADLKMASQSQSQSKKLKARGIKFFFDGSLGSQTALIRLKNSNEIHGQQLWSLEDARYVIAETWKAGFEVAVHTLGDEAIHQVVLIARELSARNISGVLNLEHVEVLRNETIQLMKPLHIRCHLQPCHWLSDRVWLQERLADKIQEAFPWERLRINQIPVLFGSDSPIEPPSLLRNLQALQESAKNGIKALQSNPLDHHRYPYKDGIVSKSFFDKGQFQRIEWS